MSVVPMLPSLESVERIQSEFDEYQEQDRIEREQRKRHQQESRAAARVLPQPRSGGLSMTSDLSLQDPDLEEEFDGDQGDQSPLQTGEENEPRHEPGPVVVVVDDTASHGDVSELEAQAAEDASTDDEEGGLIAQVWNEGQVAGLVGAHALAHAGGRFQPHCSWA